MRLISIILLLFFYTSSLWAACGGSSPNLTAASHNYSDVNDCVTVATYGDTISVPAGDGDVTWSSTLTLTKGIHLSGPGAGSLTVRPTNDPGIQISPDATSINSGHTFEISGFTFDGDSQANVRCINLGSAGQTGWPIIKIHDNTISDFGYRTLVINGPWKGVIYSNTWTMDNDQHIFRYLGDNAAQWNWLDEYTYGTENAVYFEDNTVSVDQVAISSGGQSNNIVIRFNDITLGANMYPLIDVHGNQSDGVCSMFGAEIYENDYSGAYTARIDMRGGRVMYFSNEMTSGTHSPRLRNENCNDLAGTCARDGDTQTFEIQNSYHFLNKDDGAVDNTVFFSDGCDSEITEDSEYWIEDTSFDGTSGVGVGTWTNRPGTCTEGVGYWATDLGEWNSDSAGNDGALYVCNDSNTFVLYYTPYTYPHPDRQESGQPDNTITGVTLTGGSIK